MMTSDKILLETRGYLVIKLGGIERAIKNPQVFMTKTQPKVENLTRSFMESLKTQPVRVLTSQMLAGKTIEEKDIMMLELINSGVNMKLEDKV